MENESISLNKFISSKGLCSRREADKWIEARRIKINGVVAQKGNRVEPGDIVLVDNKRISKEPKPVYIALYKPRGIVSTTDKKEKKNIVDFVNYSERLFHIGRLDKPSEGLIFMTNNGDIVNKILRAGNAHEKEYIVRVDRPLSKKFAEKMSAGIPILDTTTLPCEVEILDNKKFRIVLKQGLNRQIRRMCEYLGYEVKNLKRVRIMHIKLGNMKAGQWRHFSTSEVREMTRLIKESHKN